MEKNEAQEVKVVLLGDAGKSHITIQLITLK